MKIWIGSGIDSRVFREWDTGFILKEYNPHITEETLREYHRIHNELSEREFWFDWNTHREISPKISQEIQRVRVRVLKLGNDIFVQDYKLCSRVPFIDWPILRNIPRFPLFETALKWLLRDNFLSFSWPDGKVLGYDFSDNMIDPQGNLGAQFVNMKVVSVRERIMEIVVTDLGSYIPFFVHCYNAQLNTLV